MTTKLEKQGPRIYFRDSPFAGKDVLKAAGAHWDAEQKSWWIGAAKEAEAASLAAAADAAAAAASNAPANTAPKRFVHHKCKQCGARPGPRGWPRIYKNGICSDCYRDARDDD